MAVAAVRIDPTAIGASFRLDRAEASDFEPLIGESFTVYSGPGSGRVRVRLAKVRSEWSTAKVTQFSLIFHGSDGDAMDCGTHEFRHPALGSFSIFISPTGGAIDGQRVYQACFSRHVGT